MAPNVCSLGVSVFREKRSEENGKGSEMKFFDIKLTKDSSLLFHAIHSPVYLLI
jgi:hypothetical protein